MLHQFSNVHFQIKSCTGHESLQHISIELSWCSRRTRLHESWMAVCWPPTSPLRFLPLWFRVCSRLSGIIVKFCYLVTYSLTYIWRSRSSYQESTQELSTWTTVSDLLFTLKHASQTIHKDPSDENQGFTVNASQHYCIRKNQSFESSKFRQRP